MKLKMTIFLIFGMQQLFILSTGASSDAVLSISGAVHQPLALTIQDLKGFQQGAVQINDIRQNGQFNGVFTCRGVSLKILLSAAGIEKKDADFNKQIDLAVMIKSSSGEQVTLSWGEIFYKNPDHVIVAVSADPIFPHKEANHFSDEAAYQQMIKTLTRKVAFPRLVVSGDLFSDRCLESVCDIVVVDLEPKVEGRKSPSVYSDNFRIVQYGKSVKVFNQLPEGADDSVQLNIVGEGRGYHGTRVVHGVSFKTLIDPYKTGFDLNTVFIVSAPDAYRSLISFGELYMNPHGCRILIADRMDGEPIASNGGRFILFFPDDLMADREVKAVSRIEIMNLN